MVRRFTADPVPDAVVKALLSTASRAPSAGFSQGWEFLVLTEPADVQRYWELTADLTREPDSWLRGMRTAPALVVCLADKNRYLDRYAEPDKGWTDRATTGWPVPYWEIDTAMAAMLMLLDAVDHGLGACFFGVPVERVAPLLDGFAVPPDRSVVGVIALGHPAPDRPRGAVGSAKRGRRPVREIAHRGRFGRPFQTP